MFANATVARAAPPAFGLVASAARLDIPRWEQGLAWVPERCGTGVQLVPWCDEPSEFDAPRPGSAYYRPVTARFADECSTMGGPPDLDRIQRLAEAQTPWAVARELWSGAGTEADKYLTPGAGSPVANAYLASSDAATVGVSAASARVGIGRLEQAALEVSHGQQVMLHVPVLLLPQLHGYITRTGAQLITLAGSQVIADGGYPGTGPAGQAAGTTVWAYATSPVVVGVSSLAAITDDVDTVDAATNARTVWTSRPIAAVFDPCVHLATQITL